MWLKRNFDRAEWGCASKEPVLDKVIWDSHQPQTEAEPVRELVQQMRLL